MLKINQRVSGLRFASLGGGGTNGETKRPCRFRVHTPPSRWKRNKTHENSASVTFYPPPPLLMNVLCSVDVRARERVRETFVTKKKKNTLRTVRDHLPSGCRLGRIILGRHS